MFQEPADDADHADVFAEPFSPWVETAHTADDQFNANSNLGSFVEQANDGWIHQSIHLGADVSASTFAGVFDFAEDQ